VFHLRDGRAALELKRIQSMQNITRYTLPNGLLILLKEIHNAPVISQWIWYRVGSRDEQPGKTGISHWVEHMQFKGTPRFPANTLDKAIARLGGYWNAYTHLDWTTYFETMPADKIELAIQLEADRMVNSTFDPAEVASERTVIISERQGSENEPVFQLSEAVQMSAFSTHTYRHEVVGDLTDLQTMQRDDLFSHYRTYYIPNNAVLAIAGDFETENMLGRLRQAYENIPPGPQLTRSISPEPAQTSEHQLTVAGPGTTTYLEVAYHVPAATHPDFFSLMVADSLLSGAGSLNMFSSGISNRTSRLYRALVERELAVSIHGGLQATIDPFLYSFTAIIHPESSVEKVITALAAELQHLMETPPSQEEIKRAVKQAKALFAYGSESITNQAFWMGLSEMIASDHWYENYLAQLEAVTAQDVQSAAQAYLQPANRTLGVYLPNSNGSVGEA
jgi:zinc protease